MKRITLTLIMTLLMSGVSHGALSDDLYLRKDVFEAYMRNISANQERILQKLDKLEVSITDLSNRVSKLEGRLERLEKKMEMLSSKIGHEISMLSSKMNHEIAMLSSKTDRRIGMLSSRIDGLRDGIFLWLLAMGLLFSWPKIREALRKIGSSAPSITLEDVKRLIEENNARQAAEGRP